MGARWQAIPLMALLLIWTASPALGALGKDWTQAVTSTTWSGRQYQSSAVFNNRIYVLGGFYLQYGEAILPNDVRYSTDGVRWTTATASAGWTGRGGHTSVVFNGRIWVLGGNADSSGGFHKNDVWYSSDGASWTSATLSAPWSRRDFHSSVVFNGKIWVIGGEGPQAPAGSRNDVWYSSDGVSWTSATLSAPWSRRDSHTSLVFNGRIWVIGGEYYNPSGPGAVFNDVWYSSDGVNWTSATLSAPWNPRFSHSSAVLGGKMWVFGGLDYGGHAFSDAWYSVDGVNWTSATLSAPWSPPYDHASVVYNGKIWLFRYDVWSSADGATWTLAAPSVPAWDGGYRATVSYGGRLWILGGGTYSGPRNDVWYSWDGANWVQSARPPWGVNTGSLVYNNKMWVLSGSYSGRGTAWFSTDGVHWTTATANAQWSARRGQGAAVYNNKMWVLGGRDAGGSKNDVWWSSDGVRWTSATTAAPWAPRAYHATLVFGNKIWVMGGVDDRGTEVAVFNDIWSSADGVTWTSSTAQLPRGPSPYLREGFGAVVCDGKMWFMGGATYEMFPRTYIRPWNDVWSSTDGNSWRQVTAGAAWSGRWGFSLVVHNRKMWLLGGGNNGGMLSDVWYSELPAATSRWQRYR